MERNFFELLESRFERGNFLCVGLDPDYEKIPESVKKGGIKETIITFNRAIIDATHGLVCAFKPNPAFYEAHGDQGWAALRETIAYIHEAAPDVPVILDGKRGDIGNTNEMYAVSAFDHLHADAITMTPYLGSDALESFFARKNKGIIILCHTSNPGAGELQELEVNGEPLYKIVARLAATTWNKNGNCCAMVGATFPQQLREVREIVGDMPILTAGIGAQNGDLRDTVLAGKNSRERGIIVNASRSIIFASAKTDFAEVAFQKATELDSAIRAALVE